MDFPEILEKCAFVDDSDQMRQSVGLLLQNIVGSFCQSASLGALFDVHTFDYAVMHAAIHQTLTALPISISRLDIRPPADNDATATCRISLTYYYNNELSLYKNFTNDGK